MRLAVTLLVSTAFAALLLFPACVSLQQPEKKAIAEITARNAGYLVARHFPGKAAEILKYSEEGLTLPGESPGGSFKEWAGYVIDQVTEDPYVSMNVKALIEMVNMEIDAQEGITAKWDLIREVLADFIVGMKAAGT